MALSDMVRGGAEFLGDFAQGGMEMLGDFAPFLAVWTAASVGLEILESLDGGSPPPPIEPQRQAITELEQRKQDLAARAAEPGSAVFDALRQTAKDYLKEIKALRHELFLQQGEVEEIEGALSQSLAYQKQGSGREQAALIVMERACRLAQFTYQTLCSLELEWEETLVVLQNLTAQEDAFLELCAAFPAGVQTSEGREEIALDVDYWTDGALSALHEPPPAVGRDLPLEELHALVTREQERLAAMRALPQTALDAFCAAQIRREICLVVQDTLSGSGWRLSGFGYREEKQRAQLRMENAARDALQFTVSQNGDCQLRARFHEVGNTDVQWRLVALLQNALRGDGFSVEDARAEEI